MVAWRAGMIIPGGEHRTSFVYSRCIGGGGDAWCSYFNMSDICARGKEKTPQNQEKRKRGLGKVCEVSRAGYRRPAGREDKRKSREPHHSYEFTYSAEVGASCFSVSVTSDELDANTFACRSSSSSFLSTCLPSSVVASII